MQYWSKPVITEEPKSAGTISTEKQTALDWLSQKDVIDRFGAISDQIWGFAELGLQEFRSSALLMETLEQEGGTRKHHFESNDHLCNP